MATLLVIGAAWFLIRLAKGRRPDGRRRRFGFTGIALVVLAVVAANRWVAQRGPTFSWSWDFDEPSFGERGGFPPLKVEELRALRPFRPEQAERSERVVKFERKTPRPPRPLKPERAEVGPPDVPASPRVVVELHRPDDAVPPPRPAHKPGPAGQESVYDLIRSLADAGDIVEKAIEHARRAFEKAARDSKALAALEGHKASAAKRDEPPPAPASPSGPTAPVAAPPAAPPPALAERESPPLAAQPSFVATSVPRAAAAPAASSTSSTSQPAAAEVAKGKRPEWIDEAAARVGDVYHKTVKTDAWDTTEECEKDLVKAERQAVREYVDRSFGDGASSRFEIPQSFIKQRIEQETWEEPHESSVGMMKVMYARLEFDSRVRTQLQHMWRDKIVQRRLEETAGGAGAILLVLGTLFSYLKLDTLTRGYYTGRLRFAAGAVILATVAGVVAMFS
ncbi:MAG: hypothetical protein HYX69_00015 [Planctomycetia bacterium]|nr:hypothetical protein [Planctomycetia bacterium]